MWSTRIEPLDRGCIVRFELDDDPVRFSNVLRRWQGDATFRRVFISLLATSPYSAFRWETPPITASAANRPFEFVLLESPELETEPDPEAFAEHFRSSSDNDVVWFPNLSNDATLVVPRPIGPVSAYGHLAAFVRKAPDSQQHALWSLVGKLMQDRLGSTPLWLSTAGAGVPWLHLRIDQRPKYYCHGPYRQNLPHETIT
jgi:hypothetical protein